MSHGVCMSVCELRVCVFIASVCVLSVCMCSVVSVYLLYSRV